jgi:hypothetical protein
MSSTSTSYCNYPSFGILYVIKNLFFFRFILVMTAIHFAKKKHSLFNYMTELMIFTYSLSTISAYELAQYYIQVHVLHFYENGRL